MIPQIILDNLHDQSKWFGIELRHELPHIDRIWLCHDEERYCLHKILPIEDGEPYYHRHPWSCETFILHGTYLMDIGYGGGDVPPPVACRLKLTTGSSYVMDDPLAWHAVKPVDGPVYSIFRIKERWEYTEDAGICRTRHRRLSRDKIAKLLEAFSMISKW